MANNKTKREREAEKKRERHTERDIKREEILRQFFS